MRHASDQTWATRLVHQRPKPLGYKAWQILGGEHLVSLLHWHYQQHVVSHPVVLHEDLMEGGPSIVSAEKSHHNTADQCEAVGVVDDGVKHGELLRLNMWLGKV